MVFVPDPTEEEVDELEAYLSYLFDDHEDDNSGCWVPVGDQEALLRGRFAMKEIHNGKLDSNDIVEGCDEMDKLLTEKALAEKDRGKPTKVRTMPR